MAVLIGFLCGCGNNGSSVRPPSALSYSASAAVFTKGVAITPNSPTSSGGAVTSYSVSPALPAGLTLNTGTGVVSGTPTMVAATASYTVTASGVAGSTTTTLSITVNDQPPSALSYAAGTAAYTINVPITPNFPTNSGGTVVSYSVLPALPAGLSLDMATGIISGDPTALAVAGNYTVTATNSGGNTTAPVTIAVNAVASPGGPAAPAGLAYNPGSATYTVGVPIPENVPTSTGGAPTKYTIFPALPPGLSLSSMPDPFANATGVISGVPSATSPATLYVVTATNSATIATNSASFATATLTLAVNAADVSPSGLAYTSPAPVYVAGMAITADSPLPNATFGPSCQFSVSPDLPAGLNLVTTSGTVTGTPTVVPSPIVPPPPSTATYTVTVTNAAGTTTAPLTITIYNAPQAIPNMAQSITPLVTAGSSFQGLDTGMMVTDSFNPQVPPKEWLAGQAARTAVSPDGNTLAVLTSGFNRVYQGPFPLFDPLYSSEYVFIYDISNLSPVFKQAIPIPNAYHGLAWDPIPANQALYVSGGMGDAPFGTDPIPYTPANNGDNVHIIEYVNGSWTAVAELDLGQNSGNISDSATPVTNPIVQGHPSGNGLPVPNNGFASVNAAVFVAPMAAGIAVSKDGQILVVANYYNDSITIFTGGLSAWFNQWLLDKDNPTAPPSAQNGRGTRQGFELDLRPGMAATSAAPGTPGGEYPFWVQIGAGDGSAAKPYTAYISSLRDREIDVVKIVICASPPCAGAVSKGAIYSASVSARIPVKGQPNKMTLNKAGTLLYVAEDESDTVDVIDLNPADVGSPSQNQPATVNTVVESIPVIAPPSDIASFALTQYTGANTNSVTLSPDETQLYVTNGNLNNIAIVQLNMTPQGVPANQGDHVVGLIPTGWYPNSVSFSNDGSWVYAVNEKSPTGANPDECYAYGPTGYPTCMPSGEYNPQMTKAGLLSFPVAGVTAQLSALTKQVEANNRFAATSTTGPVISAVQQGIKHVIYILKENRTYDQILGDLGRGNGDPALTLFGQAITPNQHNLAQQFVTLDNFRATAEVSYDGWPWSTSARTPDIIEHQYPVNYAQRGLALEGEGLNRNVNVALPTLAQRQASDPLMPGGALSPNVTGGEDLLPGQTNVAAPDGPNDELNTGYLWDNALRAGLTVRDYGFFIDMTCYNEPTCQTPLAHDPFSTNTIVAPSSNVALTPFTDPYFRGFDPSFPDYYRYKEWERDFDTNYATAGLPNLTLVRFMHDHTGNFATAIDGVNTPDRDVADNDYAVGLLVQKIANSIYANNTLIFVVEDDAQDGGDHIDSHRTTAYIAGAYVKNGVVSTAYNTLDFIRTMEEVLGLPPMNLNDALATPMSDIFNTTPAAWSFTATPAAILYCTKLPLPGPIQPCNNPTPNVAYWAHVTKGMDFSDADLVDGGYFNRVLWKGMMGNRPYPSRPTGKDLSQNRDKLLADYRRSLQPKAAQIPKPTGD
ncbi:MAG: putative Ig domain-containing protein [Terracidiphilus sp.]